MSKTKRVRVQWNGPTYMTPVNGGHELFKEEGKWDYGMHVRGDMLTVFRSDAESDSRFIILGGVSEKDAEDEIGSEKTDEAPVDDDQVSVPLAADKQPPEVKTEADKPSPKKK